MIAAMVAATAHAQSELIPANRTVPWIAGITVGVPGGIPTNRTRTIDVTQAPYNADKSGASNASPALQAAINAAAAGDVVYMPAGVYRVESTLMINQTRKNITVRGAGIGQTIVDARVKNTLFSVGSGSDYTWSWPPSGNTITAGLTKGSTTLSIPDTSAFSVGQLIRIVIDNQSNNDAVAEGATPTVSVNGYDGLRSQMTRVTAKTSSTLSIFPAVYFTPDQGLTAKARVAQFQTDGVGIESMTIDGTNGELTFPINLQQCYGCWIKDVKIYRSKNYGFYFTDSLQCEARGSYVSDRKTSGGGTNGAGFLVAAVSGCLFEDNTILQIFPAFEVNFSSMGNVVAYNLMELAAGGTLNTNHAPHNSFNLYEGNVTPNIQCDGYFGSASDDTLYRNWIHGTDATRTLRTWTVSLNRFTRNYSIVGNIIGATGASTSGTPYSFGNPNLGNSAYTGTAQPTTGHFWSNWNSTASLSKRTSDTAGQLTVSNGRLYGDVSETYPQYIMLRLASNKSSTVQVQATAQNGDVITFRSANATLPPTGTAVTVWWGANGYQELDLDVERSTVLKANYNYYSRGIPAAEQVSGQSLPASLYRTSKPEWFGDLNWPPFDPYNPAPGFDSIPAGYRYVHGGNNPGPNNAAAPTYARIRRQ